MNRRLFGALGVVAALTVAGGCKEDPLSDLDGNPAALVLDFSYLEVPIGDALPVTASVLDGRATPLIVPITFRTCNAVVTAAVDPTYLPVPATSARVLVTAVTYGSSCVIAEGAALADTVQVATFPVSVVVSGPDTVVSGVAATYTYEFFDRAGNPVSGVPVPTWTVGDTTRGTVTPTGGVLSARDTGLVNVTVTGVGTAPAGVPGTKAVLVLPAPFDITIVPNPADPGQVVKLVRAPTGPVFDANTSVRFGTSVQAFVTGSLTPDSVKVAIPDLAAGGVLSVGAARLGPNQITQSGGAFTVNTPALLVGSASPVTGIPGTSVKITRGAGDPAFDSTTRVFFGGVRTFVTAFADSIRVPVPAVGTVGATELRITRMDVTDVARRLTFTADTGAFKFADPFDAVNDDPATAPAIGANGDYFIVVSGACVEGAGPPATTDCDDFFRVTNPSATDTLAAKVVLDWFTGSDVDILWCKNATCSGAGNVVTGGGATAANPETSDVKIPPGATWYLWLNLWDPAGAAAMVTRVRFSGLP